MTVWEVSDGVLDVLGDADRDELRQSGVRLVEHAEGAVSCADELDGRLDDATQHRLQVEIGTDGQHGLHEAAQRRHGRTVLHEGSVLSARRGREADRVA